MNNLGTLHLKDNDFQQGHAENSELLIKVSAGRLSYAVINGDKQLVILYDSVLQLSLTETIDELLSENNYLKFNYKSVKIAAETFHYTFIPQALFDEANIRAYQSIFSPDQSLKPYVNTIKKAEIKNVFNAAESLVETLLELHPDAHIFSQAEPLIDGILYNYQGEKKLILQVNHSSFEIIVISNHSLLFYNIFEINNADDFNYYLLYTLQQLNLSEADLEVILCGDIERGDQLFKRAEKYYSRLSFASNIRISKLQGQFSAVPEHQFFTLFSLYLCE